MSGILDYLNYNNYNKNKLEKINENNEIGNENELSNNVNNIENDLNNGYSLIYSNCNLDRLKKELKEGVEFKIKKFEDDYKLDEKILNSINEELKKGVDWEMDHFKESLSSMIEDKYVSFNHKSFITGLLSGTAISLSVVYISLKLFR